MSTFLKIVYVLSALTAIALLFSDDLILWSLPFGIAALLTGWSLSRGDDSWYRYEAPKKKEQFMPHSSADVYNDRTEKQ
jgi:hypothetical protein